MILAIVGTSFVKPKRVVFQPRYVYSIARMSTPAYSSEAFRGAFVLMEQGAISRPGFNGPYIESSRQAGFVTYGISNVMRLLADAEVSMIPSWYQKWQVNNLARPEALAGTVHNTLLGFLDAPIDRSLLDNTELLDRVAAANAAQNFDGSETFLLAQARRVPRGHFPEMHREYCGIVAESC